MTGFGSTGETPDYVSKFFEMESGNKVAPKLPPDYVDPENPAKSALK